MGGDHTVWNGVAEKLTQRYRVVAPDLRGHGRSVAPTGSGFTFAEYRADLERLIEARKLAPVHLVGLSAGGYLALDLALARPEAVRSLVLVGSGAHADAHTRAVADHWKEVFEKEGPEAYALRVAKDLFSGDWLEDHIEYVDSLRKAVKGRDMQAAVLWGAAIRTFDARPRIGRLRKPMLLLHGMDDRVVDPSHARLVRQAVTGTELRLLAGAGHLLPVERTDECASMMAEFFGRIEAAPPPPKSA